MVHISAFVFVGPLWHITAKLVEKLSYKRKDTKLLPCHISLPFVDSNNIERQLVFSVIDDEEYEHLDKLVHQTITLLRATFSIDRLILVSPRAEVKVDGMNTEVIRDHESLKSLDILSDQTGWQFCKEMRTYFKQPKRGILYKILYAPGEKELNLLQDRLQSYFHCRHYLYFTSDKTLQNVELKIYTIRGKYFIIPIARNVDALFSVLNRMASQSKLYRCKKLLLMIPQYPHEPRLYFQLLQQSAVSVIVVLSTEVS